ncbi:hypothetical protein JCM8097_008872 [Rhodosporidiobolus ruineniae]
MALSDRTTGGLLLALNILGFLYYTAWTLLTPFLPSSSPLLILFPLSREWAIRLPCLVLLFGLTFVGMVTGFVMVGTARRKGGSGRGERAGQGKMQ